MNQQITSKQNNNDAAFPCRCLACGETINVTCGATKVCCCGVCQIAVTATPASEQVILAQRQRLAGSELNRLRLQCQECETRFELDYSKPRSQVMCPTCSQIITLTTEHHKPEIVIAQEQSISPCYYRLQCQLTQCQRQYDHQEQSYREAMMQIDEYRRQRGQIPEQYREGVYLLFHYVSKWQSLPGDYPLYNREVSLFLKSSRNFAPDLAFVGKEKAINKQSNWPASTANNLSDLSCLSKFSAMAIRCWSSKPHPGLSTTPITASL